MKTGSHPRRPRAARGPFYHPFDVRSLKAGPREVALAASPEQCAAVAGAVDLPAVASLAATFRLVPRAGGRVEVEGRVEARVSQTCVVTLEPFDSRVDQQVSLAFAPEVAPIIELRGVRYEAEATSAAPVGGNDDQPDPPDPIIDDMIDLGAVAVEFLVLGLDPYRRRPDVDFDEMVVEENDAPSAFAALGRFKDRA